MALALSLFQDFGPNHLLANRKWIGWKELPSWLQYLLSYVHPVFETQRNHTYSSGGCRNSPLVWLSLPLSCPQAQTSSQSALFLTSPFILSPPCALLPTLPFSSCPSSLSPHAHPHPLLLTLVLSLMLSLILFLSFPPSPCSLVLFSHLASVYYPHFK